MPRWAFSFDQKLSWNVGQIILYFTKFLPCLNWVVTCFQFQRMFWKNNCFQFWWRTYTKHCRRNYLISCIKRLSSLHFAVGQVLSISGYDLEHRCRVSKNIAIKTWRWKFLFWFCFTFVYFADLKKSFILCPVCCSYKLFQLYRPSL